MEKNIVTVEEVLEKILERRSSGNCNDTDFLIKSENEFMKCEEVGMLLSAFWVAIEDCIDKEDEPIVCNLIAKNIEEQMEY